MKYRNKTIIIKHNITSCLMAGTSTIIKLYGHIIFMKINTKYINSQQVRILKIKTVIKSVIIRWQSHT